MDIASRQRVFDLRARSFEEFSGWSRNEQLYHLCVEPLNRMPLTTWCMDVGGGTGWVARRNLRETGRPWVVVDLSFAMGQHARPALFVQGDAAALPFEHASIGYIVMRSLLHYVSAADVLVEIVRTLAPEGGFVIAQKVLPAATDASHWYQALFRLRNPSGSHLGTEVELRDAMDKAGLVVVSSAYFREKRLAELERWISKDGTAPEESRVEVKRLLLDPPKSVLREGHHRIEDGMLYFERTWVVLECRRQSP
jgi:SAM-dependent methyltransferase